MAHSLSAKKRIRQNTKQRSRNRGRKSKIRELTKAFDEAIVKEDSEQAEVEFRKLTAYLDKIGLTSTIHKNTAARTKSRSAKRLAKLKAS